MEADDDTVFFLEMTYKFLPAEGKVNLVSDIEGCRSDEELWQLAGNIDMGLLRPVKALGGKTVQVIRSLQLGVENSIENILRSMTLLHGNKNAYGPKRFKETAMPVS